MQNATVPGVVRSVERHRRTLHVEVSSDNYGLVFLILPKGQCPSNLLKEGKQVCLFGIRAGNDKFTARKILDPSSVVKKKRTAITEGNFFNTPRFKLAPIPRFG